MLTALETATGAILSKGQGPKALFHPVAFASQKLSPPERNYDVGDLELLAIKFTLEEWRYLLEGDAHPIMIFTVNKNLEYLRTAKRLRPQKARWALFFSRFNFHISYRPGSKNGKADAVSRIFPDAPETTEHGTILSAQNVLLIQPDLKTAIRQVSSQCTEPEVSSLKNQDGLLWFQNNIFIPQQVSLQVLRTFYDHKIAGKRPLNLYNALFDGQVGNKTLRTMSIHVSLAKVTWGPTPNPGVYKDPYPFQNNPGERSQWISS